MIEAECGALGGRLNVVSEVESIPSLTRVVDAGLGWTVMPEGATRAHFADDRFEAWRIVEPSLRVKFALCSADREPLSEAAAAVLMRLRELFQNNPEGSHRH